MNLSEDIKITSFEDLHKIIQRYDAKSAIYRGVKNSEYKLIPQIGRITGKSKGYETEVFNTFRNRAIAYLEYQLRPTNEWEWLALAQHHGLPTRLLDWTRNPLTAMYFAVEDQTSKTDGAIYVYTPDRRYRFISPKKDVLFNKDNDEDDIVRIFNPPHVTKRILAQDSLFTYHHTPSEAMEDKENDKVDKFIIPYAHKSEFHKMLYKYGIHKASLFPGLEGLAEYLKIWTK